MISGFVNRKNAESRRHLLLLICAVAQHTFDERAGGSEQRAAGGERDFSPPARCSLLAYRARPSRALEAI